MRIQKLKFSYYFGENYESQFPNSDFAASHVLALPIYSELKQEQIEFVVEKIKLFMES